MKAEIPLYILKGMLSHYKRIVENAKSRPDDHRTADAIRLARKDIAKLEKIITQNPK